MRAASSCRDEFARATNRRVWRRTFWVVGIALVAGGLFGTFFSHAGHGLFVNIVASMLTFGGLAGMFSVGFTALGRSDELRLPLAGVERSSRRLITRTALGRRGGDPSRLSPDERRRALEYAETFALNQPLVLAQSGLLFVGLIGTQLLGRDDGGVFETVIRIFYVMVMPIFLVVITILTVRRVRLAAAFVKNDAAPRDDDVSGGAAGDLSD